MACGYKFERSRWAHPPMCPFSSLKNALLATAAMALASCSTMSSIKSSTSAGLGKMGAGFGKMGEGVSKGFGKVAELSTAPFKPGVPVVDAREEELQERPLGHEQAVAYQKRRRRGFWIFGGPIDFVEPTLPSDPSSMDAGLLPPKVD